MSESQVNVWSPQFGRISTETSKPGPNLQEAMQEQLSTGWMCRFDPKSAKYTLIPEHISVSEKKKYGTHFWESRLSSPGSSVSRTSPASTSKLQSQVSFKARISSDANANRIYQQFPNTDESYINHLMRLYHNRENLVISALLSEGHSRSNVILDESLFYKIKSAFPNVETEIIRRLLIKNDNREHSTISSILGLFGLFNTARYEYSQCPQMKLKYLKFAYPDVDEIILLDLLFNNDHNVNKVIEHLNNLGYRSSELKVKISKISETALVKEATEKLNTPRPVGLPLKLKHHHNLEAQQTIRRQLHEKFDTTDVTVINAALEACGFDAQMAHDFLMAMTPQDSEKYFVRTLPDKCKPKERLFWSRAVQTNLEIEDLMPMQKEHLCDIEQTEREDKCTWTKEDDVITKTIIKLAKGPLSSAKGPCPDYKCKRTKIPKIVPTVARGPNAELRKGPQPRIVQNKTQSKGVQIENKKGPIGKQVKTFKELSPPDE